MLHIIIVEDDVNTLDMITRYFENEMMTVRGFLSTDHVISYLETHAVDLCILDVMIGHENGFDLLREIKSIKDVPIIFVTAKSDEFDRIYGIEIGADDYLTKPFSPRELVVRAKRLLSRNSSLLQGTLLQNKTLHGQAIEINLDTMEVKDNGIIIDLTLKEYEALVYFLKHPRLVLPREKMIEEVWGFDAFGQTRMVDDIVKRLRKKLSITIETIWGVGYKFHG